MSCLGRIGRFGNQLLQYGFLRLYAERHGLAWETPPWVGQVLFGLDAPWQAGPALPLFSDEAGGTTVLNRIPQPVVNVDLFGYFLYHTSYFAPQRERFRALFQPVERLARPVEAGIAQLRSRGRTLVALHLRRGDFGTGRHWVAPSAWYLEWLKANWDSLDGPVLVLASDEPQRVMSEFSAYNPVTIDELGVRLPEVPFFPDFHLLRGADILCTSNSTFSFVAAMLNDRARAFLRPDPAVAALVPFDPWDSEPLLGSDDPYRPWLDQVDAAAATLRPLDEAGLGAPLGDMRTMRRQIADIWLATSDDVLPVLYFGAMGEAHRRWLAAGCRALLDDGPESGYIEDLLRHLGDGLGATWSIQYLLAAMLYRRADELPMAHDFALLPPWLQADYMQFLREAAVRPPTDQGPANRPAG